jgi:hypothetical protein
MLELSLIFFKIIFVDSVLIKVEKEIAGEK